MHATYLAKLLGKSDCKSIPEVIGTPDLTIVLTLTKGGLQLAVIGGAQPVRQTFAWSDL